MPFKKISTKMEVLHDPEGLLGELKNGLIQLKKGTISPAEFVYSLFGGLGTGSHAVYAITQALIIENGSTEKTQVIPEVRKFIRLQFPSIPTNDLPKGYEIERALNDLITINEFTRSPGGTIRSRKK